MKCKISNVFVFTKNEEKNEVSFISGLNIISGVSQTGKSAIIEIIDYCLASTESTIPKGVIVQNSILYSIVLEVNDCYIVLARRPFKYKDKLQVGRRRMFVKVESKKNFVCEDINYEYFQKNVASYKVLDEAKKEIENYLQISVYKQTLNEGSKIKNERVSVRNMVSFLFQHQNLIANKFALFYRFDNSEKMKQTISQFPVFLGLVDQEYYNVLQTKEIKEKELKKLEKSRKIDEEFNEKIQYRIRDDIREYYKLIGKEIEKQDIDEILDFKRSIDKLDIEEINISKSIQVYHNLEDKLKQVNSKIYVLENEVQNINLTLGCGDDVEKIVETTVLEDDEVEDNQLRCPFCNSEVKALSDKMKRISECKRVLNESLESISTIKKEYLEKEKYKLSQEMNVYIEKQKKLKGQMNELKEKHKLIQEEKDFKDLIIEKRIRIEQELEKSELSKVDKDDEIDNLNNEILGLNKQLDEYDLKTELQEIQLIINGFMNKIAGKLDFEEQYIPNLRFNAETFDLYQYNKNPKEKIFLSSMGSGSNWLTCHLALFLGLHYCFAKLGKQCSIPSILLIDQPSQIYFPNMDDKENDIDIESVKKIYETLEWAIDNIEKETGIRIQVIALDHASGLKFDDKKIDKLIRKRWNEKGNGLIDKKNIGSY